MTLPTSGPISFSQVNTELELGATFSSDLNFLNNQIRIDQRPQIPNMFAFYGKAYYQRNLDGNCNNGNCNQSFSSGNIQCQNCSNAAINCVNCDTRRWLQVNCNCFTGQYNCTSLSNQTYNCNCGKIICKKLNELGYFDDEMNKADQLFGIKLKMDDPEAYNGYIRWATPVVHLMEGGGSPTLRKFVFFWEKNEQKRKDLQISVVSYYMDKIARPWAQEMAYRMKAEGYNESDVAGRFIMNIGLPMCRLVSKFGKDNQWPMWAKTLGIWGTVTVLLVSITLISFVDKVTEKVLNIFRKKD